MLGETAKTLEDLNLTTIAAIDHLNISSIYVKLHEWFKKNPPETENYLGLSEKELDKASELGADEFQVLHCRANALLQNGDLERS